MNENKHKKQKERQTTVKVEGDYVFLNGGILWKEKKETYLLILLI